LRKDKHRGKLDGEENGAMSTPLESVTSQQVFTRTAKPAKTKSRKGTYLLLIFSWMLLIGTGVMGAMLYTEHLKLQITQDISSQTAGQLQQFQTDYTAQIAQLKDSMSEDMAVLQKKVDSLNELLAFTKDSANSKTDNSNQLYTQLSDVKNQLDELKKNLDVLK
jgi:cell division protein FtsB